MKIGQFVRWKKNIKLLKENLEKQKQLKQNKNNVNEKELVKIEKRVKKNQLKTLPLILPIAFIATIFGSNVQNKKQQEKTITKESLDKIDNTKELTKEEKQTVKENIIKAKEEKQKSNDEILLEKEISKVKTKAIIEEYEDRLKEIRRKLRNVYYEDDILKEIEKIEDNPSEENLDKINKLIDKLEKLKEQVKIDDKYEIEKDYIKVLAEEDIKKIEESKEINHQDSKDIYKSISKKIVELQIIEENLSEKVEKKKEIIDKEVIEELKDKNSETHKFNNELLKFQDEQNRIVENVHKQIAKDINNFDKERIQLNGMYQSTNLTMLNVRRQMRIPGVRSGKKIFSFLAAYLFYSKMIKTVRPIKQRYKKLQINDISKDIENNINAIDDMLSNLKKVNNRIDDSIEEFIKKYKAYADTKEYKKVLNNLEQIRISIKEKEYELIKIKEEQLQKERELNNNRVYTKHL